MDAWSEENLFVVETSLPPELRDFCFYWGDPEVNGKPVHPVELLGLSRTAMLIDARADSLGSQALPVALARLLVPCLQSTGSGRHIVVEE